MTHQTVLAQFAAERHWTLEDGAARYRETAAAMDLDTTVSPRQWGRWCAGELRGLPRPVCCRVLERMFGGTADMLLSPPGARKDGLPPNDVSPELLAAAAEESTAQLAEVESAMLGPATLEQAGDDVIRLARAYAMTPPAKVVADAVRMRRRVQELLTRTAKPSQQMDLYLLLGELCGLLAVASFDLGDSQAATSHARAAWGTGSTSTMTGRACDRADLADHVDPTRRARRHGFTVLTALTVSNDEFAAVSSPAGAVAM